MPTDCVVARDKRYLFPQDEPLHIVGRDWCFEWWQGDGRCETLNPIQKWFEKWREG